MLPVIIAIVFRLCCLGILYPQSFVVTELQPEEDVVIIETATGHQFSFYGIEDWQIGDGCAAVMYSNDTPEITDDIILTVRYTG